MRIMRLLLLPIACLGLAACKPEAKPAPSEPTPSKEEKAADPSDASSYIGMTLEAGRARAEKAGIVCRVVEEDGQKKPVTMDHQPDRLNFAIAAGKIIRVTKG